MISDINDVAAVLTIRYQAFTSHGHPRVLLPAQAIRSSAYEPIFHALAERPVGL